MTGCGCRGAKCRIAEDDPRHGSDNGYKNLGCRCHHCVTEHRDACNRGKRVRLAKPIPEYMHGFANTYVNYDCRCPPCYEAYDKRRKTYQWKRAA